MIATVRHYLQTFLQITAVRWFMALAWTVWISIILIQSTADPLIDIGIRPEPTTLEREIAFTILHMIAFALMNGLWWWVFEGRGSMRRALIPAVIIALVFGAFTETMQGFAPDRYPQLVDFLADVLGALLVTYVLLRRSRSVTMT